MRTGQNAGRAFGRTAGRVFVDVPYRTAGTSGEQEQLPGSAGERSSRVSMRALPLNPAGLRGCGANMGAFDQTPCMYIPLIITEQS